MRMRQMNGVELVQRVGQHSRFTVAARHCLHGPDPICRQQSLPRDTQVGVQLRRNGGRERIGLAR